MTTRGGGSAGGVVVLRVKLLGVGTHSLDVLVMPQATRVQIPISLDGLGEWRGKDLGETFDVRVPMDFAARKELIFGGGTLSTRPNPQGRGGIVG